MPANPLAAVTLSIVSVLMFVIGMSQTGRLHEMHFSVINKAISTTDVLFAAVGIIVFCAISGALVAGAASFLP